MSVSKLCILGATGSIGRSTVDVARQHPSKYQIYALSAHSDWQGLLELCKTVRPAFAVLSDSSLYDVSAAEFKKHVPSTELLHGSEALTHIASLQEIDIVMAAIVGRAGLESSFSAVTAGKRVLLANKESLVLAGSLFMSEVARSGATLLPIDSEHNAIFQCLPDGYRCGQSISSEISKLILTASGGPFRGFDRQRLSEVTPEQACAHPNWIMGRKISVDSASLMNKGLELIEACWLFNTTPAEIDVLVHPQSVIHSMVQYCDGSVLAQMGEPDMRTPISYGLAWPDRVSSGVSPLDFGSFAHLSFEQPDVENFPCLALARRAFEEGGMSSIYLNAANEVAVEAFLKGNIRFTSIADIIESVMIAAPNTLPSNVEEISAADFEARTRAGELIEVLAS